MKHAINYAGGYWQWESEYGSGVEHTRDGAEIEYAKSFLKKKQEPDWEHLLCITPEDRQWIILELKKKK